MSSSPAPSAHPLPLADTDFDLPPGPDLWAARRARWLAHPPITRPTSAPPSDSQNRLVRLMNDPAVQDPDNHGIWRALSQVYSALITGHRLKQPMPLATAVKLLRAGWVRDGTWPKYATIGPDSDDDVIALPFPPAPAVTSVHAFAQHEAYSVPASSSPSGSGTASELLARIKQNQPENDGGDTAP